MNEEMSELTPQECEQVSGGAGIGYAGGGGATDANQGGETSGG